MKKSIFGKVGAAAVVLTLVTASLVGGTFAKYVTDQSATATGTVAHWGVKFMDGEKEVGKDYSFTLEGTGGKKTILPGDSGKIEVVVDGQSADVGFDYKVVLTSDSNPDNVDLEFYENEDCTQKLTNNTLSGTVNYDATDSATMQKTVIAYWKLPAGTGDTDADKDVADTAMAGKTATFKIDLYAEQMTNTPQA